MHNGSQFLDQWNLPLELGLSCLHVWFVTGKSNPVTGKLNLYVSSPV